LTGEQLKSIRIKADLTQSELAEIIGTSQVCVSNWELGINRVPRIAIKTLENNKLYKKKAGKE